MMNFYDAEAKGDISPPLNLIIQIDSYFLHTFFCY